MTLAASALFLWSDLLSWKHAWRLDRLVRRARSVLHCSLDSVAAVGDGGGGVISM